ncbi:MAG: UDP-glucose 4-epimerase GalE [Hyphomonadaceae bacterium]
MATLITGGAGYIGSHVAWALLDAGREVVIVDNLSTGSRVAAPSAAEFHEFDLADQQPLDALFARGGIDSVIHMAGSVVVPDSVADPLAYYSNNTGNSITLFRAALRHDVKRFVFSSTAAVYASTTSSKVKETDAVGPLSPYGLSKLMVEQMLADSAAAYPMTYAALRYFNVAGADPKGRTGQSTPNATHLIKVAAQTALGHRPELTIFGNDYETPDGTCVRDFIHVSDLADAHIAALRHLESGHPSEVLNVGYGRGASVLEVVAAVERVTGSHLPKKFGARRLGDAPMTVADSSRIRELLDWRPKFEVLDDIVAAAIAWEKTCTR